VFVRDLSGGTGQIRAKLEHDGHYEATVPRPGTYTLFVRSGELVCQPQVDVPDASEHTFDFSVRLGHLSGRLVDAGAKALAGLVVDAMSIGDDPPYQCSNRAKTDARGEYEMALVPGKYRVSVRTDFEKERSFAEIEAMKVPVPAEGPGPRADFELQPSGAIEGVVLYADGRRAPGARVLVDGSSGDVTSQQVLASDEEGRFCVERVSGGRHWVSAQLVVEAPEPRYFASAEPVELDLTGMRRRVELRLVPAVDLRVSLVDVHGSSSSAQLEALDSRGRATAAVDIDEVARALLLVPGRYRLRAWTGARLFERDVDVTESNAEVEFRLE